MKLNNLSSSAFADKIGVQRSSISHILSGRNKPSLEFVGKVLSHFPNVSADWLIIGDTKIKKPKQLDKIEEKKHSSPTPISEKQVKKVIVFYTDHTFEEISK